MLLLDSVEVLRPNNLAEVKHLMIFNKIYCLGLFIGKWVLLYIPVIIPAKLACFTNFLTCLLDCLAEMLNLFSKCLFTKCLSTRCLFTKCLFTRCLFTRCLFTKCLFTGCLFTKCLFTVLSNCRPKQLILYN